MRHHVRQLHFPGQTKWPCTFRIDKRKSWYPPHGLLSDQYTGRWIYLDFSNIGFQGRQSYSCSILHLMAEAEYFAHWNIIYEFYREALTPARELWHTYQFSFSSVAFLDLVQYHNVVFTTGLELSTMHQKALQIGDEFGEFIPTTTMDNKGSNNSVVELKYDTIIFG
ncbi:hypothetical protein ACQJBY_015636 [Aegilops geniculata]